MPISLASNATAPRIFSARRPSVISASGSPAPVKVVLQDELRRDAVASELWAVSFCSGFAQHARCSLRCEAFVAKLPPHSETALELLGEAPRLLGHRMRRAVGMHRKPDHEQTGTPLCDQGRDGAHGLI